MLAEFHWLRPDWLLLLPLAPLAAWWLARRQLAPGNWLRVVDRKLAPYVLSSSPTRGGSGRWWLLALTGLLAVLALAGPVWQRLAQPVYRSEQALVIAVDLSRSMDAQDVAPSRLQRAKLKVLDLLKQRQSGQTALVVYSANAFTVTPLTTDTDTIAALVNSLSTDIMPSQGSIPAVAISKGEQLLKQAGAGYGEILLITDGGTSPAAEKVARTLQSSGYTLSVLGVGTQAGAPIPKGSGGFVTDASGNIVVPTLEESALKSLAQAGGGRYASLSADNRDIDYLLAGEVVKRGKAADDLATDQWREEGPWLVVLLLPLVALAFRRGLIVVLLLALLPLPRQADASVWDQLWHTPDQRGQQELDSGDAKQAAQLFHDPQWAAVASYRAGDFAGSAGLLAGHKDATSIYNRGNALARQGRLKPAIDAYDRALQIDPNDSDAKYNRDLLQKMLDQQQKNQQNQKNQDKGDQQKSDQKQGGDSQSSPSEQKPGQQGQNGQQGNGQNSQQNGEQDANSREDPNGQKDLEAMQQALKKAADDANKQGNRSEPQQMSQAELDERRQQQEQEQSMEQYLRRIPNDPGGLLRRKFRYQYQKTGKDQDGNNTWPDDQAQPW